MTPRASGRETARDVIALLARVALGGLFVWAAATKIGDMARFAEEVADYQLLSPRLVPLAAAFMPGIEVAAGLALIAGVWARPAALLLSGMLVLFIGALSQSLLRGIDLRCGCFGGSDAATWGTVWRDVAMLIPAALVLWLRAGRFRLGTARGRAAGAAG